MEQQQRTAEVVIAVWLTVQPSANRIEAGKMTIYAEVKAGRLRAARFGGRRGLRFRAEFINQWRDGGATPIEDTK